MTDSDENESKYNVKIDRKARLVVRNLSYQVNEQLLRDFFQKFGHIQEVCILKRPDGKLVGCAFIQFSRVIEAARAVAEADRQIFMKRPLKVAWAVPKHNYVKEEPANDEERKPNIKEEETQAPPRKKRKQNSDAVDGQTLFIKSIPFETTDEELGEVMSQFGPTVYALINTEPISGHSKGTGFVRFKTKESADLCLGASGKIQIKDFTLDIMPALTRQEVSQREQTAKKNEVKDSRNLYLAKEGLIMAGSSAAEGVSAADMAKRLHLERVKTQMLKDLNRFISRDRLAIHNLPESYDDAKLRRIVERQTGCKPRECRVMRENQPSRGHPLGRSKGYGFLSFPTHEEALQVLRKLNNNPTIFGKNTRPIVAFSVEDKKVENLKRRRMEKSRLNNPTWQQKMEREQKASVKKAKKEKRNGKVDADLEAFAGTTSEKGIVGLRSKSKLAQQARAHLKRINKEKKVRRKAKEQEVIKQEKKEKDRTKKKRKNPEKDDHFAEMVNKYKAMIDQASEKVSSVTPAVKKTKWYQD